MTAVEFLHPLKGASRRVQVQGALLYLKHYRGCGSASPADIRSVLVEARVPRARGANVCQALSDGGPATRSPSPGVWEVTGTGEARLLSDYGLGPPGRSHSAEVSGLRAVAAEVSDTATREYIEEAVECLQVEARRASVVFLWAGAVAAIREEVWRFGARGVEAALKVHNPKAKFRKKGDFEGVKDADLLQIAHDMEIYDKSQRRRLNEALDLRNDCGHPAKYRPGEKKVASFIEDLVAVVWPASR
jgi:hypothetical protein